MIRAVSPLAVLTLLASCTPGEVGSGGLTPSTQVDGGTGGDDDTRSGDGDGDGEAEVDPGSVALTLTAGSASLELGQTQIMQATVTSQNGFAGNVTLSPSSLPEGWTATFSPSSTVVLAAGASEQIDVTLDIATDAVAGVQAVGISASSEVGVVHESVNYDVANVATMVFENGTGAGNHSYTPMTIRLGATVRFVNLDTGAAHRIHSNDIGEAAGFPHQADDMEAAPAVGEIGGSYEVTITTAGTYDQWYCHNHEGNGDGVAITVVE